MIGLSGTSEKSKGFLVQFKSKHIGMVQRLSLIHILPFMVRSPLFVVVDVRDDLPAAAGVMGRGRFGGAVRPCQGIR